MWNRTEKTDRTLMQNTNRKRDRADYDVYNGPGTSLPPNSGPTMDTDEKQRSGKINGVNQCA